MNTYWKLYWLTRLEGIENFILFFAGATLIIAVIMFITWAISYDEEEGKRNTSFDPYPAKKRRLFKKTWITSISLSFILWLTITLLPSAKEVIFIVAGGKTIDWAMQDSSLTKMPSQSTQLISAFLEKQINELTSDTELSIGSKTKDVKDSVSKEIKNTVVKELLK